MARKMKDSGIEWIGEIPEGWETIKLKNIASIVRGGSPRPIEAYMSDNDNDVNWIRISDTEKGSKYITHACRKLISSGISKSRFIKRGSLILTNSMSFGEPYILAIDGCIHDGWVAFSDFTKIDKEFLYYFLVSPLAKLQFEQQVDGGVVKNLNIDKIGDTIILLPPYNEQNKIIAYLDCFTSNIDLLLSKTISSIEEYKKLKQAVITQAVTKGVRGKREMKDSGVEWIGEIPAEWRKTQLRHCATIKSGITLGKSYSKDTVLIERPYLRVANVQGGYVDLNDLATIEVTPDEDLKYRLHSGDVLMTEGGDRDKLGRGCVWHGEIEPCLHQNHVFAVQTNETILLPEFLEYLTASDVGRSYFDVTAIKTTNLACTSSSKVLAFTIPLPPIEEQIEIVSFIKKRSLELNKLIMKKELLVQELESYKKSLIYEVVTGKREV